MQGPLLALIAFSLFLALAGALRIPAQRRWQQCGAALTRLGATGGGAVVECSDESCDFNAEVKSGLVVVDFYANW